MARYFRRKTFTSHLDDVLLLGNHQVGHPETQRLLQGVHQQEVAALQPPPPRKREKKKLTQKRPTGGSCRRPRPPFAATYKDVRAVHKALQPLLGDQQHLVEEEEGALLLHPVDLEGAFQNQLAKAAQVGPAPVDQ